MNIIFKSLTKFYDLLGLQYFMFTIYHPNYNRPNFPFIVKPFCNLLLSYFIP